MLLEYSPERTSKLAASDRRSSPRALCLLQPELAARTSPGSGAWSRAAEHAPRTCFTGQTEPLLNWLQQCQSGPHGMELRLDLLPLGEHARPRLSEALEVPLAEQRWLLESWALGDRLTHFQRLGVAPTLDQTVIRRAYLATCQRLHPDRYYGKHIGRFAGVLDDLFHRAHAAHVYLADPRRCGWYLAQLAAAGHAVPGRDEHPTPR